MQQVSSIARAERSAADLAVAGTFTGAVFGATGTVLLSEMALHLFLMFALVCAESVLHATISRTCTLVSRGAAHNVLKHAACAEAAHQQCFMLLRLQI